jgi:hypothetical protein
MILLHPHLGKFYLAALEQKHGNTCSVYYHESGPGSISCKNVIDGNSQHYHRASTVDSGASNATADRKSGRRYDLYKARGLYMYVYRLSEHQDTNIVYVRRPRRYPTLHRR